MSSIVQSDVTATLDARLVLENGTEVFLNVGNLLHRHGRVADVLLSNEPNAPHVRLAVETRAENRGYRGVVETAGGQFEARVNGTVLCTSRTAREAAIRRAVEWSKVPKRTRPETPPVATVETRNRGSENHASSSDEPFHHTLGNGQKDESGDEVTFTREVTREERDAEGRRNAISVDDDE